MDRPDVEGLRERSKNDREIIAGSEVRSLCKWIDYLSSENKAQVEEIRGLKEKGKRVVDAIDDNWSTVYENVDKFRALIEQGSGRAEG